MKILLILLLIIHSNVFTQNINEETQNNNTKRTNTGVSTLPKTYEITFKVATRFQGDTIFVDNKSPQTIPVSVTMFDIQFINKYPVFGILRIFVQTPIINSSTTAQLNDPFLKNLNNTSIGIGGGGNWYIYSTKKENSTKWFGVLLSFFGYFNLGVANKNVKDDKNSSNIGAEINLRMEHYLKNHLGILYGFDLGFSTLHYRSTNSTGDLVTTATASLYYGVTIGFMF